MSKTRSVDIGVINDCEPWKLHARFFPSKIGGKPAWLHRRPPQPSSLKCGECNEPLIFLCQIYAPIEEDENAFHRSLFIFICKSGSCSKPNESNNIKIFRSQLKRRNEFYSYEPPVEDETETFDDSKCPSLCKLCGCKGPSHCAKCKKVNYCSRSHQIYDWKNGHKEQCGNEQTADTETKSSNIFLFPELELITDVENEEDTTKEVSVEAEMKYLETLIKEKKAGSLNDADENELEAYTNKSVEDKAFSKFKKRVSRDPDQVLRYDLGGEPLWIASTPIVSIEDVPKCQYCDGSRQFECQIMPQLLNHLGDDAHNIDWGILAIFTCVNNCNSAETPYKNEFVFKQDIVNTPTEDE